MSQDLYGLLELGRGCDTNDIRRQYLKLSRVHHPDKGGDPELFKKIQSAYEILSDDQKRAFYDQTGRIPGEEGSGGPGPGPGGPFGMGGFPGFPFDIGSMFGMFGEGARPRRGERMPGKAPPKKTTIALSLHDFYHGKTVSIHLQQQRFCPDCRGEGSKQTAACDQCHGQGHVLKVVQMGPMMMQSQVPCMGCGGNGKKMGPACGLCRGGKFVKRDKTLDVVIQKGAKPGDTIVLEGESSHVEQWSEPGDVVVELVAAEEDHIWVRKGAITLTMPLLISLKDSLCGGTYTLSDHPGYPEGLKVNIPIGIQSGETITINGAGMPIQGTENKGDCILTITVGVSTTEKDILTKHTDLLRSLFHVSSPPV